jgi:hypothetical protein
MLYCLHEQDNLTRDFIVPSSWISWLTEMIWRLLKWLENWLNRLQIPTDIQMTKNKAFPCHVPPFSKVILVILWSSIQGYKDLLARPLAITCFCRWPGFSGRFDMQQSVLSHFILFAFAVRSCSLTFFLTEKDEYVTVIVLCLPSLSRSVWDHEIVVSRKFQLYSIYEQNTMQSRLLEVSFRLANVL